MIDGVKKMSEVENSLAVDFVPYGGLWGLTDSAGGWSGVTAKGE